MVSHIFNLTKPRRGFIIVTRQSKERTNPRRGFIVVHL